MSPLPEVTDESINKALCGSIIFAILVFSLTWLTITQSELKNGWLIFFAALMGGLSGFVHAMLDHVNLKVKDDFLREVTKQQSTYLFFRAPVSTALGVASAYVAHSVTAPTNEYTAVVIAFAIAYVFDMSKLLSK